tara:strand:+ start:1080 stop:1352 length:273 start_codon:yes stop_codon:yes gene_type:complete
MIRLGAKTKKGLRIGAKVGAVAGAIALGTKGHRTPPSRAQEIPQATKPSGLVSSTGQLKSQSQDFSGMATKLRMREESKSMGNPIGRFFG